MAKVKTVLVHKDREYNAEVKTIDNVSIQLDREIFISLSINFRDISFGGFVLGKKNETSEEIGSGTKYLYDWVHAVFQLTGVENFKNVHGKPVLVLWKNDGSWGDRIIGLATIDGSFVFIPGIDD